MKMKKHYLAVLVTVLWMVVSSMPVLASGPEHPPIAGSHSACCEKGQVQTCGGGHAVMCGDISRCIPDLTAEQTSKIRELGVACQKKMITFNADLKKLELDMKTLFADHADKGKVDAKIDEISRVKAQMLKECYGSFLDVRKLLTDKQKKHLDDCCKKGSGACCQKGTAASGKCCQKGTAAPGKCCQKGTATSGKCSKGHSQAPGKCCPPKKSVTCKATSC